MGRKGWRTLGPGRRGTGQRRAERHEGREGHGDGARRRLSLFSGVVLAGEEAACKERGTSAKPKVGARGTNGETGAVGLDGTAAPNKRNRGKTYRGSLSWPRAADEEKQTHC